MGMRTLAIFGEFAICDRTLFAAERKILVEGCPECSFGHVGHGCQFLYENGFAVALLYQTSPSFNNSDRRRVTINQTNTCLS